MFSLMCAWINGWVNNGEADDLRHHRPHYDVIVMFFVTPTLGFPAYRLQLSADRMRSNISGYFIQHYNAKGRTHMRFWIHNPYKLTSYKLTKRRPISRPHGRAMGCLLSWPDENLLCYDGIALYLQRAFRGIHPIITRFINALLMKTL